MRSLAASTKSARPCVRPVPPPCFVSAITLASLRACFKPRAAWWQNDVGSGRAFGRADRSRGGAAFSFAGGAAACGCAPRGGHPAGEHVRSHRAVASRRDGDRAPPRCAFRWEGCRSRRPKQPSGGYVRCQGRSPRHPGRRKARQRRCAYHEVLALPFSSSHAINRLTTAGVELCSALSTRLCMALATHILFRAGIDLLKAYGTVVEAFDMTPADLKAKISLCDALIVRSATKVTKEVFAAGAGRLKVVGRAGVGIDNVDLVAATEAGVLVVNAPTANTVAAAEHGIALLCALARFVPQADMSMKAGKWDRSKYTGTSLVAKTLAIMGFGKVGSEVARRAKGLGMTVIAFDPFAPADRAKAMGVELVSFDDACARGDFFSLHMPLTPSTEKLFNDATFAKMKKGARIINVARGGVIDDDALVRALDSKQVAAAALDVFEEEPPAKDNPLVKRPDVICTPHLGASTVEAQEGVAVEIAEAVIGALNGELAATAVNAPMVPAEMLSALAPFIGLAEKLGRIALQLVDASSGLSEVVLTYKGSNKEELDTRLLRANVIKGLVQRDTTASVNLVNADTRACLILR